MSQHDHIKYSFQIFARVILDQHIYSFEKNFFNVQADNIKTLSKVRGFNPVQGRITSYI